MQITIHRGINQIGGCITEIATANTRIIIDLGTNLPDNEGNTIDNLATKDAVEKITTGIDAILYTHYHGDHVGLSNLVPKDKNIKQYIGDVAQKISIAKHERLGKIDGREQLSEEEVQTFKSMIPMKAAYKVIIGDITVTPYFVSHSAYESFMFLIEADGKRILHTGDFRDHGYLGCGLEPMLNTHVKQVDVLITEGTMTSRTDTPQHENILQQKLKQLMCQYKNVFVISSSTDMERLATISAAHKEIKTGAPLICDEYQKTLLDIFTKHAAHKEKKGLFNFSDAITFESRTANPWGPNGFTMLFRCTDKYNSWLDKLLPKLKQEETVLIFSRWGEYINPNSQHAIKSYCDMVARFKNVEKLHTSGHASTECLAKVCTITNPTTAIIPIHSEKSSEYYKLDISDELKSKITLESTTINNIQIIINSQKVNSL